MAESVFVTGAGGFIGGILLRHLSSGPHGLVKALMRRPASPNASDLDTPRAQEVIGDLLDPDSYRGALAGCGTVVHLAAATGKARPRDCERVNVEGTRVLLEACKSAGVRRFLYVSTIAAGYPDQRYYAYAKTKARAEQLVRESGLACAVVRPTLVLGEGSPIWRTLLRIARLPVIPLPQGSRPVSVQPIHADDVARGIALLMDSDRFDGEVLDLGGPRPLPFAEFLGLVQLELRGEAGRIVRVPLRPVRTMLALMEPMLRPPMPVTAGQLALFANDSTATENWLLAALRPGMPSTEAMIEALVESADGDGGSRSRVAATPRRQGRTMSVGSRRVLEKECRTFAAYLLGASPGAYVREHYERAAYAHGLAFDGDFTRFDRITLALARKAPLFARCADAYCALFHPRGALRRKLIVLAAILEHAAPTSEAFDRTSPGSAVLAALSLAAYASTFAASLLLGAVVLAPASVLCWIADMLDGGQRPREAG
jgi:NADH dehydrogenase